MFLITFEYFNSNVSETSKAVLKMTNTFFPNKKYIEAGKIYLFLDLPAWVARAMGSVTGAEIQSTRRQIFVDGLKLKTFLRDKSSLGPASIDCIDLQSNIRLLLAVH